MNPNDPNQAPQGAPQPGAPTPPPAPAHTNQPGVPTPPPVGAQPPAPMQPPAPGSQPLPQPGANGPQQPMQPGAAMPGSGGSKKTLIMIIAGVAALLIIGVVLMLVLGGGSDDAASGSSDGTSESSDEADESDAEDESGAEQTNDQGDSGGSSSGSSGGGASLSTDGEAIDKAYELGVACETGRIPSNLTASTDTHFRVETFQESNTFAGSYSSAYMRNEERNRTDSDNELNIDGIGCITRQSKVNETVDCDFELDDKPIVVKMKRANYDLTLYDAHSGEVIGTAVVESDADCPFFASIDENNEMFASPNDEDGGEKIADLTKGL